jgi:hypothetical protein
MPGPIQGGCHCGNIAYTFAVSAPLEELGLRTCMCSFCRIHGARTTSDPNGRIELAVRDPKKLRRYRFGLKTADFYICDECGAFVGAVMTEGGKSWMTVNANTFKPPPPLDFPAAPNDFGGEDTKGRTDRRKARWTPLAAPALLA